MEKKILIPIFFSPRLSNRDNLDSRLWSQGTSWRKSKCPLYSLSTLNVLQIDTFFQRFYIVVPFHQNKTYFSSSNKPFQLISFDVLIKMISIYICPSKHFCQRTQVYYENIFFSEQGFAKLTFPY